MRAPVSALSTLLRPAWLKTPARVMTLARVLMLGLALALLAPGDADREIARAADGQPTRAQIHAHVDAALLAPSRQVAPPRLTLPGDGPVLLPQTAASPRLPGQRARPAALPAPALSLPAITARLPEARAPPQDLRFS